MALYTTKKKGLDLPIAGSPRQEIEPGAPVSRVALMADDYIGMKPTMFVKVGEAVRRGQILFEDKKCPGVAYTAPAAGTLVAINRGQRRALQSVVIELNDNERKGQPTTDDFVTFESYTGKEVAQLNTEQVKALLIESGMWTAIRKRPFSRVADPADEAGAIFVTAMDTNPLAPDPDCVLKGQEERFRIGLEAISKLTSDIVYVCKKPGSAFEVPSGSNFSTTEFSGPHPSGTVGVHMHFVRPVHRGRFNWHLNYQDVINIGELFRTGRFSTRRVIALAGPQVTNPRLVETRVGASTDDLVAGMLAEGENRVISGSVLSGRAATGEIHGYLGRFHHQISVLREGREREFLGWLTPGFNAFSTIGIYLSKLMPSKKFSFTTTTNGSHRAMIPIGTYERVMPMDIMPTFLLRALLVKDVENAERLGCLELDEEDLALCTFVCPGKNEYGPALRAVLTQIEKEG